MESILRIEVSPVGMKVRGRSWGIHLMSELSLCLGMDSLDNRLKLHAYPTLSQIFFFLKHCGRDGGTATKLIWQGFPWTIIPSHWSVASHRPDPRGSGTYLLHLPISQGDQYS